MSVEHELHKRNSMVSFVDLEPFKIHILILFPETILACFPFQTNEIKMGFNFLLVHSALFSEMKYVDNFKSKLFDMTEYENQVC